MRVDFTLVKGNKWLRWCIPLTPTSGKSRSGRNGTTSTLRTTLVTMRIIKMKNIILMMVKLLTMDLTNAVRDLSLILVMMRQLKMRVQCQRMPALWRYWTRRWRRGPIPLVPHCLDRGDKVYLGGFTNDYCTNCDNNEVSASSNLESCESATGKELAYSSDSLIDTMGIYHTEFAQNVSSEWPGGCGEIHWYVQDIL